MQNMHKRCECGGKIIWDGNPKIFGTWQHQCKTCSKFYDLKGIWPKKKTPLPGGEDSGARRERGGKSE